MTESLVTKIHSLPPAACTVLHELCGEGGTLRVTQHEQYRWLQIDDANLQSMVDVNEPARLLSPTTIFMLMGLAFIRSQTRLLNLGLGGGAVERSVSASYPGVAVESVELDARVIDAAKRYFFLPDDQVVHEQAAEVFMSNYTQRADLVLADLFYKDQSAACVSSSRFFRDIKRSLSAGGACVMNLLYSNQRELVMTLKAARTYLPLTWLLEIKGHQNVIAYFMDEQVMSDTALHRNCVDVLRQLGVDENQFDWNLVALPRREQDNTGWGRF